MSDCLWLVLYDEDAKQYVTLAEAII